MAEYLQKLKRFNLLGIFFSEEQINILKECKIANSEDVFQWRTKNVIFPFVIICIPFFLPLIFKNAVTDYMSIIFSGSISLIGINILFGMSSYLIKVNNTNKSRPKQNQENSIDEKANDKLNQNVIYLRSRLDTYKNILVIIGAAFYISQSSFGDFNSVYSLYSFMACTILILLCSIKIGRFMYIIKDDFFEKTYYGEVNDVVMQARSRWAQKY